MNNDRMIQCNHEGCTNQVHRDDWYDAEPGSWNYLWNGNDELGWRCPNHLDDLSEKEQH